MHPRFAIVFRLFVLLLVGHLFPGDGIADALAVLPDSAAVDRLRPKEAPVVLWNRTITVLRSSYGEFTPIERARIAVERLSQFPANLPDYRVVAADAVEGGKRVAWIKINGRLAFVIIEGDADSASGESFDEYKNRTVQGVASWLEARKAQHELPLLFRGLGFSLLATTLCAFAAFSFIKLMRWFRELVKRLESDGRQQRNIAGVNILPYIAAFVNGLLKMAEGLLLITIAYLWLTFVLSAFPYTSPWATQLSGFLLGMLGGIGTALLVSIPALFTIGVIFFITRLVVRVVTAFFRAVEEDTVQLGWFEPETAKATRRIVVVLIWVFALIIAYPLIPGSETKAFQGVSVFLGLLLSLGSAGLVGQLIGGIVSVYTRAFKPGDYVRIGEHEGVVQELGLLAAKIVTIRKEEVTIPNALLMGSTTINFTRQAKAHGVVVATSLTIGYDAPWRQVHAMLEMAAERSRGILKSPKPFVLQKALSDFAVEYTLMMTIERAEERYYILSELHGHIQDVFNEYGVQIMSPNFVMQPDHPVVVPAEEWFREPSRKVEAQGE